MMKPTRRTIEDVNASIEEQMSRDELSDLRRSIGENGSDDTKSALRSLQQRIDRLADDAASWTREGVQQTRDTIAQNPLAAVSLAPVLGVILGVSSRGAEPRSRALDGEAAASSEISGNGAHLMRRYDSGRAPSPSRSSQTRYQ